MPESFEAKLCAENPELLAALVDLLGGGFAFPSPEHYDMALEWASRAFQAGREAAAQAIEAGDRDDEAALMGRQITALIELCGRHEADGVIPVDEVYAVITTDPDGEKDR